MGGHAADEPDGRRSSVHLSGFRNAYIASGHGMLGLTLAPGTAEIITEMVTHHCMPLIANAVAPSRFRTRH